MALSKREKNLAMAAGVLVLPFAGWLVIGVFGGSSTQLRAQKAALLGEIKEAKDTIRQGHEAQQRLDEWNRKSLPKDVKQAGSRYKLWLMELCESDRYQAKFQSAQFKPLNPKPLGSVGNQLTFTVSGVASLEQLTRWLYGFYSADYLHQIKGLTINPEDESKKLRVDITVEALALQGAVDPAGKPRDSALPEVPEEALNREALDKFCSTIGGRAIFSRYTPPPPVRSETPVAPPSPPLFDHGKFTEITGITEVNGRPQVWIRSRTLGKEFHLFEGDSFEVGPLQAKIIDIQIQTRTVTSEVDGKQYLVALGNNLRDAKEVKPAGQ
ncbi:MAG: hypothetical protein ACYC6Y_30225 [Thermoguttaceae bacterium]